MTLEWHANGKGWKHSNCPIHCKNCYIDFLVLKVDNETKDRGRILTFKKLIYR